MSGPKKKISLVRENRLLDFADQLSEAGPLAGVVAPAPGHE